MISRIQNISSEEEACSHTEVDLIYLNDYTSLNTEDSCFNEGVNFYF